MAVLAAITLWLLLVAGVARLWGREHFARRCLLIGFVSLLPFPGIPLALALVIWRRRLGPVEIWTPRMRRASWRVRPTWAERGLVEYEPWKR